MRGTSRAAVQNDLFLRLNASMPEQRYDAARMTLGSLLSVTSPKLEVPDWQRSYAWREEQLEAFWQDLVAFDAQYPTREALANQEYFLGSAVLVNGGGANLVLDGQQRLATATILLSVLRDSRAAFQEDAAIRLQNKYIADFDDERQLTTPVLQLNLYDREFFRREVQDRPAESRPTPSLRSHALIRKAREYFQQRLADEYTRIGGERERFERNLRLGDVVCNHLSLVVVTSTDEDNAAAVFETLNDRGIGLSTPDLLRNFLLRRASDEAARGQIVNAWQTVLGIADEANVDEYLRHFWVSHYGDVKSRKLYREIKNALVSENADAVNFSTRLADSASIYRDIVRANSDDPDLRRSLEATKVLGAKVLYPALLSALEVEDADPAIVRRFAADLVTTFVRYNVIGGRETTTMEEAIYAVAAQLRRDGDFVAATTVLRGLSPSAAEFVSRFAVASVTRVATARYLLAQLEEVKRATGEVSVQLPDRVHVEHIYPQTPLPGAKLARHAQILNRLGNLTLLARGLNASIKNAGFDVKKDSYASSQLLLTQELLSYERWDEHTINERQRELSGSAFEAWHYSGEAAPEVASNADEPETSAPDEFPEVPA